MTILAELYALPWAVRPEVLSAVVGYVERKGVTPEMLARACHFDPAVQEAAQQARWNRYAVHQQTSVLVDGSQALYRRGRTAILPITGPIVRRGNLMTSLSGGPMTSVELVAKDFTRALEDPSFDAVLLDVDSPGGEASGISELAAIIAGGRDQKTVVAYVGDLAASAAYWLAAAASEIVVNRMAALGSIGVVMAVPNPKADPDGHIEIVSSVSPNKRPDPTTKDGRQQLQALVDQFGDIFVEDVAAYRSVDREHVLEQFGQGGLKIGADAVEAGMADRLGSFEEVLAELARPADEPTEQLDIPDEPPLTRGKDRPRSVPAPAASLSHAGAEAPGEVEMDLLDSLRHLVATAEAPASADREALIVTTQHASPETPTAAPNPVLGAVIDSGDATLRQRLVAAEAENARLKFAQIQTRAEAFARAQTDELRAFAPEVPHLVQLYCVLASDDETHGPVQLGQGKATTRVTYLENLMATRQSRKELTADLMGDTVAHVLTERSRPKRGADEAATAEELAAYLNQTPTGRAALVRLAGQAR